MLTKEAIPTPDRLKEMDFTIPLVITRYRFLVPWPKEESRLLAPIRPFQSMVAYSFSL